MRNKITKYCDRIIEFCLYLLIFCLPFAKAGIQIFCWLAILFWIIKKIVSFQIPMKTPLLPTNLNRPLLAFILACSISTILSVDFGLSIEALFAKVIRNVILFIVVLETINKERHFRNILITISISATLMIADGITQYFRGIDFLRGYTSLGPRLQASFTSPNGFGGWLIIIIPIIWAILIKLLDMRLYVLNKIKMIGLIVGLSCIYWLSIICLGMTLSRAVWIGFAISCVLLVSNVIKLMSKRIKIFTIAILILSTISIVAISPKIILPRLSSIMQTGGSGLFRLQLWMESLEIIEDFPIFGVGLNTYSKVGPTYAKAGGGYYPHNSYLQMAAEIGIIGLISFLWFIIKLFRLGMRALKETKDPILLGFLAAIVAFLTQSFLDVNLYALQLVTLFWFILGLTIARINLLIKKS